jgi:hypothetical protein
MKGRGRKGRGEENGRTHSSAAQRAASQLFVHIRVVNGDPGTQLLINRSQMGDDLKNTNLTTSSSSTCSVVQLLQDSITVTQDAFIHKSPHMGRRSATQANGMDHLMQIGLRLLGAFADEERNCADPIFDRNQ